MIMVGMETAAMITIMITEINEHSNNSNVCQYLHRQAVAVCSFAVFYIRLKVGSVRVCLR